MDVRVASSFLEGHLHNFTFPCNNEGRRWCYTPPSWGGHIQYKEMLNYSSGYRRERDSASRITSTHCNKFELRTTLIYGVVGKWSQKMQRISSRLDGKSQEGRRKGFPGFQSCWHPYNTDAAVVLDRAKPTLGAVDCFCKLLLKLLTIWRR